MSGESDRDLSQPDGQEPVAIPVNGELDLHAFRPGETIAVLESYVEACRDLGILMVRIIHGKGIGVQRDKVHAWLRKSPAVITWGLDSAGPSGWGATWAKLRPKE
jgi:DNA-nicking Smr family endonuclease